MPQDQIDDADDSDSPRAQVVNLILSAASAQHASPDAAAVAKAKAEAELREDLRLLKMSVLKKRAIAGGVHQDQIDDVDDSDDPRAVLVDLLVSAASKPHAAAVDDAAVAKAKAEAELRAELRLLKMSVLKKRALDVGVPQATVGAVDDEEDPKTAIITLVLDAKISATRPNRPHNRSKQPASADIVETTARGKEAQLKHAYQGLLGSKHAMLSYQ